MANLDSILKSRDITLQTKFCLVKDIIFPVVMYGCQSWTIKKAEHRRIDTFIFYLFIFFFKTDNKGLLYSTGNYIQYLVITYNERESEKLCIYLNHFAVEMKLKIL